MHRFDSSSEFSKAVEAAGTIVALGSFDGVHLGHQVLLKKAVEQARKGQLASVAYTFSPHPRKVLNQGLLQVPLILTDDQKTARIAELGVDYLIVEDFSKEFMNLDPDPFIREILVKRLRAKGVVVGYNFSFGRRGYGTHDLLERLGPELGFSVYVVEPVCIDDQVVSSTLIRTLLRNGAVERASQFLGRPFEISGEVVHGFDRGRQIGFPTANIYTLQEAIPKDGIYVCEATLGRTRYKAVTYVGSCPTFNGFQRRIEVHLLNFSADIYGRVMTVRFLSRIRDDEKFSSVDQLCKRIKEDIDIAREYFKRPPA